jgi:hypothetical protein
MTAAATERAPVSSVRPERSPGQIRAALWRTYQKAIPRYMPDANGILAGSIERNAESSVVGKPSALDTAEMLKAAFLMDARGVPFPLDARGLLDRLMADHVQAADHQVTALTLWAAALGHSHHATALWDLMRRKTPVGATQSMPIAWNLCAACEYAAVAPHRSEVADFAGAMVTRLLANHDAKSGLFYASGRREGWLRRRVADATLSSQTYPILALAMYARTFGRAEVLAPAEACANQLVALQGPQGQWWRRYDARRATVLEQYPVYSVNQDGTVPTALGHLQREIGAGRYESAIGQGLLWEDSANESGQSLIDEQAGFVAGSIEVGREVCRTSWEMRLYQPARGLYALLSNPEWIGGLA